MQEMITEPLYRILHSIDLVSILVGTFLFVLFVLFLAIGLRIKGRFFKSLLILLSILFLCAIPPAIIFGSKYYFYRIEITYNHSRPLMYSDSFLVDMGFRNIGKLPLHRCFIEVVPKRKNQTLPNRIRDSFDPIARISYSFKKKILVGQTYEVSKILPYQYKNNDFYFKIKCK